MTRVSNVPPPTVFQAGPKRFFELNQLPRGGYSRSYRVLEEHSGGKTHCLKHFQPDHLEEWTPGQLIFALAQFVQEYEIGCLLPAALNDKDLVRHIAPATDTNLFERLPCWDLSPRMSRETFARLLGDKLDRLFREDEPLFILFDFVPDRPGNFTGAVDLEQRLVQTGPRERRFPPGLVRSLFSPLLRVLGVAHRHKVYHHDINPQNLLSPEDEKGRPRLVLVDWGNAETAWPNDNSYRAIRRKGMPVGSPHYMAPISYYDSTDPRPIDLYQIGLVIFETLTGINPFFRRFPFQRIDQEDQRVRDYYEFLKSPDLTGMIGQYCDQHYRAIMAKALSPQPEQNFASAEEVREALARALPGS